MGLEHGTFCTGCCWALMALLFVAGVMNLLWVAALTLLVCLEKILPARTRVSGNCRPTIKTPLRAKSTPQSIAVSPSGLMCFSLLVRRSGVGHGCVHHLDADAIAYVAPQQGRLVFGVAGGGVKAVIVRLTGNGTVWTTLRRGAFYAQAPGGRRARAIVKWLRDGSRHRFVVHSTS